MVWNIYTCLKINIKHIGVFGNKLFDRTIMFWDIKIKNIPFLLLIKKKIIDVCINVY